MRLKTYLVKDMREALSVVRADLGENAVIVASEKAKDGTILVRAAVDDMAGEPAGDAAGQADDATLQSFDERYRDKLVAQLRAPMARNRDAGATQKFDRATLLGILLRNRLPDSMAPALAEEAQKSELSDLALALASALDKRMTTTPIDVRQAKAFLIAGCHGAGKTTVAAKLAAHARMAGRAVRLVATDIVGAGALARLEALASPMDVEVVTAVTPDELASAIHLADADNALLIADTAAFDARAPESWRDFLAFADVKGAEIVGVVSAAMDAVEACEMAQALAQLGAKRMIVTGLDIARRKGTLAALSLSGVAIAQVTRSPYLDDELEPLTPLGLARALIASARSDGGV